MAKPNYSYEKRQRELEKKRKKAEKLARKSQPPAPDGTTPDQAAPDTAAEPAPPQDKDQ